MNSNTDQNSVDMAIKEARTVIDHQIALIEQVERATLRIVYICLIAIGAFIPVIDMMKVLIPTEPISLLVLWLFILSAILFLLIFIYATLAYRSKIFYAGYGDSPNLNIDDITNVGGLYGANAPFEEVDITTTDAEFKVKLLEDYSRGIRHNNLETQYRYRVQNKISYLLVSGIAVFGLAVGMSVLELKEYIILSIPVAIFTLFLLLSTHIEYYKLKNREDDQRRFTEKDYSNQHGLDSSGPSWWPF